jgi:hypothetical protein
MASYRIARKTAQPISSAIREFIQEARMTTGLNTHLVFKAWDEVSGAGAYTLKRYLRSGTLYITTKSSVVRSRLEAQKPMLLELLNDTLARDEFFDPEDRNVSWVKDIVLR